MNRIEYRTLEEVKVKQKIVLYTYIKQYNMDKVRLAFICQVTERIVKRWLDTDLLFTNEDIKIMEQYTTMRFPVLAERSTNLLDIVKYYLGYVFYLYCTAKERHFYRKGVEKGVKCIGYNDGILFRTYCYDYSSKPKKNYIEKDRYKELFYPLKNKKL